ncbi:MAG: hypothetical protein IJC89_04325 [Clostridia bacterium]|nr:hypothetical protein [Clostridia bacterium]
MAKKNENAITTTFYKNKPLVKKDNMVYLGYLDEAFMVEMEITDTAPKYGVEAATNVVISLIDNTKAGRDRVVKKAEREDLNKAFDIASFWLCDALGEEEA